MLASEPQGLQKQEKRVFRRTKRLIGLDVGSSSIKAIELSLEGSEAVVTGFARAEIPQGGSAAEALAGLLSGGRFHTKRAVASLAGQDVVVKFVPMMRMSAAEARSAIRFETDKYVPFDLAETQLDCQVLERAPHGASEGAGEGQMTVLVAACKSSVVEERVALLSGQGLQPVAIDLDLFALANAYEFSRHALGICDARAIALVDIGSGRTAINVMSNGETCFSREVQLGGADMTAAIARRLGIEACEAEALKRAGANAELDVHAAITPVLEDLVGELNLSLDYVENHEGIAVAEILLSGGAVHAPGVVSYIEQATGRPARVWNPLEGLRVDADKVDAAELEACASQLAVALGLASRMEAK